MPSLRGFELRDGVYVSPESEAHSPYRRRWETEAASDPVRSATASSSRGRDDYETLTAKVDGIWRSFPVGRHFDTVLEIGPGYGRIPIYLSTERRLGCRRYYGVDVSETMLRHLVRYRERFDVFPHADVYAVCVSAERLPLEAGSVDLAISHAAFLHMEKADVALALREVARVLRPGGSVVFESSFPNRYCPANAPGVMAGRVRARRVPHYMKYYSRREVRELFRESGLGARASSLFIEPSAFAIVPRSVGRIRVPLARSLNRAAARLGSARSLRPILASGYRAFTWPL